MIRIAFVRWKLFLGMVFVVFAPALAEAPGFLGIPFRPTLHYRPAPFDKSAKKFPAIGESSAWLLGGPTPWFTTRTTWDSTSKSVTAQLLLNGKPFGVPERYSLDQYRKYRLQDDRTRLFREEAAKSVSALKVVEKEALEIQVPLKVKSKVFQRVFGGDRVGLRVNGELSINGEIRKESNDRNITQQGQQQQTNFKIDQRQRFTITGNIGDKVTVRIDQDSERLFEFENSVKIEYTGNEDEIIQKIEAGNIALDLPGTSLATFSGQNKGLFGLKGIAKIGPLKLTTIASLEKGKKNKLKFSNGERTEDRRIQDIEYARDQIFALDTACVNLSRQFGPGGVRIALTSDRQAQQILVYTTQASGMASTTPPIRGYAMAEPPPVASFDTSQFHEDNVDNFINNFYQLPESDFSFEASRGILILKNQLNQTQLLAVAYRTQNETVGSLEPLGPENSRYLLLKLLRGTATSDTAKVWDLMLRNYYSLHGQNVSRDGFEATIYKSSTEPPQQTQNGAFYTKILGVDRIDNTNNSPVEGGDGKIDLDFVDFSNGFIWFPALHPFAPYDTIPPNSFRWPGWIDNLLLVESQLDTATYLRQIYHNISSGVGSQYYIQAKVRLRSNVINLGVAVLEGSDEVTSDGRTLNRGSDYTIDYFSGTLTILDQSALAAGRNLEVTYESGEIFQLDRKTLLGVRAEYSLWEDSFVGFTFLSLNEKPLDKRVRLGNEPLSNRIWDVNTRLQFKPDIMTRAMDALPMISTEEPSRITIEGEFAQVFPNPNSLSNDATGDKNGVAYVDDFESSKRTTPLPITWRSWSLSAYPLPDALRVPGDTLAAFPARGFRWYNPYYQEQIKNIWPERDINSNVANTTQTMVLEFNPFASRSGPVDTVASRKNSWGAISRYLGGGYSNQQETKYVEIWLKNDYERPGKLFLDFGRISENIIPDEGIEPNTEDLPISGQRGDGILQSSEDTGIDGFAAPDPVDWWDINKNRNDVNQPDTATVLLGGQLRRVLEPRSFDDYNYNSADFRNYNQINGTENNRTDEGGRYPSTEDLNGNGITDKQNDFYRIVIDLGDMNSPYIAGGNRNEQDPAKRWFLYRIPIADTIRVNSPDLQNIQFFRVGLSDFSDSARIRIAEINMVGNEWREPGPLTQQRTSQYALEADVLNTYDNAKPNDASGYVPPPGVAGAVDPVSDVRQKEQSLRIKINQLPTGETSYLVKTLYEQISLLDYNRLKMFIHGGAFPTKSPGGSQTSNQFDQYQLYFKLRMGSNPNDSASAYYEISKRVYPGWDSRNNIDIQLEDLPTLKYQRSQLNPGQSDTSNAAISRILPDGTELKVVGRPSLGQIRIFAVAIQNRGKPVLPQDKVEIWADELRVTDVKRTPGTAYRVSTDFDFAKILTMHFGLSQTDGNFHNVNLRTGTKTSTINGGASTRIKLDEFLPKSWGLTFPVDANYTQTISKPDYLNGGDISLDRLSGKTQSIWDPFWKYLTNIDMLKIPAGSKNTDTLLSYTKIYSIGVTNIARVTQTNYWWENWFANKWNASYTHAENYSSSPSLRYSKLRQNQGSFSFALPIELGEGLSVFGWTENLPILKKLSESKLGYTPNRLSFSAQGNEQLGSQLTRERLTPTPTWSFDMTRGFQTSYRFFQNWNFDYSLNLRSNAIRTERERLRIGYAAAGKDVDFNDYARLDSVGNTARYDSTGVFPLADSVAGFQPNTTLFQKLGGYHYLTIGREQAVTTSWNPKILDWLGTEYRYNTRYNWSWGANQTASGRNVNSGSNADQSYTLRLKQLFGRSGGYQSSEEPSSLPNRNRPPDPGDVLGKPGVGVSSKQEEDFKMNPGLPGNSSFAGDASMAPDSGQPATIERRGRGRREVEPEPAAEMDSVVSKKKKTSPLQLLWAVIDRMDDINVTVARGRDYTVPAVELGQADWKFQLGLSNNPKLSPVPRFVSPPSARLTRDYTSRSGFRVTNNITVSLDHKWTKNENITNIPTESIQKSVFLLKGSDGAPQQLDLPNFSVRWGGLETAGPWSALTSTVSLENGYQATSTTNYGITTSRTATDTVTSRYIKQIDYTKNWNPLIGVNIQWKNKITTTARYTQSETFNDAREGQPRRGRSTQSGIQVTAGYTMQQGFRIPIKMWPFNNKRFKNQTDFSLSYNQSTTRTENAVKQGLLWGSFVEQAYTTTYTLAPKVTVTFSRTVTGYVQYEYGATSSKTGSSKLNAFKFNVSIQIRG